MTARRDGDHFVLNGVKRFITNGKIAEWAAVFANIEGNPGATGLTVFIVPLDGEGSRAARWPTRWATGPAWAPPSPSRTSGCRRRTSSSGRAAGGTT